MTTLAKRARRAFTERLETGEPVLVTCRTAPCLLPAHLYASDVISLVYGHRLTVPIPDLFVGLRSLQATLSFGGRGVYCTVPWSAVTRVESGGKVWFDGAETSAPQHAGNVLDLMSQRTPADRAACHRRLGL